MNVPRKTITAALVALVQSATIAGQPIWKSPVEPTARHWAKVSAMEQPYAGLYCPATDAEQSQAFGVTRWLLHYSLLIYARRDLFPAAADDSNAFAYFLDDVVDAIEVATYGPQGKGSPQTLYAFTTPSANLVQNCTIWGRIDRDDGLIDAQGKIEIPIQVITGI